VIHQTRGYEFEVDCYRAEAHQAWRLNIKMQNSDWYCTRDLQAEATDDDIAESIDTLIKHHENDQILRNEVY